MMCDLCGGVWYLVCEESRLLFRAKNGVKFQAYGKSTFYRVGQNGHLNYDVCEDFAR
jgi:hypothetical protein